jgi:hypothetical protein
MIKSVAPGRFENQITVTLSTGMILAGKDVKWSQGRFIAWDGREYEDRNTGKKKTAPAIKWETKDQEAAFNELVFAIIDGTAKPAVKPAARPAQSFGAPAAGDGDLPF